MNYQFDERTQRKGTCSEKWDLGKKLFGDPDVLPLWVADMDFKCPPAVIGAVTERAKLGIYGYTTRPQEYLDAIIGWFGRRHGWQLNASWIANTPGVVPALSVAVQSLTEPGDAVILQSPVYNPFYDVIVKNGRKAAENPLVLQDGAYRMDYGYLESLMQQGAKLMLLCNPHNPGGRVWTKAELERLGELCGRYGVKVVSDEIHCDLVFPGNRHYPFASLSQQHADMTITCLAPSKTFNIPGLASSFTVISNPQLRQKFTDRIDALAIGSVNYFGPSATIAAYNESEDWLEAVLEYLGANRDFAVGFLAERLPMLIPVRSEGTYLLWIDCRALGLDGAALKRLMYKDAKVAFTEGSIYGRNGEGFLRVNLACSRELLAEALERFAAAVAAATK
ncbi:putative C-S lyase [Paenibacillus macerans]|uniref:cysteine-S-conjugate beta-lyase n=1 Tax=Paenibacillus macerans TaxID=44252 RepID=A0A6N8EWS2_PAEMA|nr:MalY/PatB family protein [Paenibacillus macerans]MED4957539.1 pyridoxal phosphate-dependent aminotransferase [Paenibacillus macerans]MUG24636.1 putative C-S lyase [Paenibacillus macerans]